MLGEDLMSEILLKLPVKSLSRFRCVCKSWFHLIKSHNFIHMHLKHNSTKTDLILLFRNQDLKKGVISSHAYESLNVINELAVQPCYKISEPCNGLVCLLDFENQLALWNPSREECLVLPRSPFPCPKGWDSSIQGFGFGFVSNPNDYKVISFVTFDEHFINDNYVDEPAKKVAIYDLSTDSWREIECDCPYSMIDKCGTLFNGALHWIAVRENSLIIPSFSLSTEVFQDIELPNDVLGLGLRKSLTIVDNSLALFAHTSIHFNSEEQFIDIWVMREYGVAESWTKQFSIGPLSGIKCPLMLWKKDAVLLENSEGQLISCALDTHEIEELGIQGWRGNMRAMVYQESLVSLFEVLLNEESDSSEL